MSVPMESVWILDFVKHGSTGELKDDGSHGKEGGKIGYRRSSSHIREGWSYRPFLAVAGVSQVRPLE